MLGPRKRKAPPRKQIWWDVAFVVLFGLGVFMRQHVDIPTLRLRANGYSPWQLVVSFVTALIVAAAVYPLIMKWTLKRRTEPGVLAVCTPFGLGFFLDLARVAALSWAPMLHR